MISAPDRTAGVLAGNRLALARLLTEVENDTAQGHADLDALFSYTGRAHIIGVTGSPGAGKSSLVNQLARSFRSPRDGSSPRSVAIVAVDPTSPFSGGALLGDRVRMRDLTGDPGVFVRSMATRGALGGLARTTAAVVQALDAAGFELILIETVGAGQAEVDIARLAHTTLVVEAPGMGDDIQAIKAGILEIADIIVVNKADHSGAENTTRALRMMVENGQTFIPVHEDAGPVWTPVVLETIATQPAGIEELVESINAHAQYLRTSGQWQVRDQIRLKTELEDLVQQALMKRWRTGLDSAAYTLALDELTARKISPYQALKRILAG